MGHRRNRARYVVGRFWYRVKDGLLGRVRPAHYCHEPEFHAQLELESAEVRDALEILMPRSALTTTWELEDATHLRVVS